MTRKPGLARGRAWRALVAAAAVGLAACADPAPEPRVTVSAKLLAAAESQSDALPLRTSTYGDYLAGLVATRASDFGAAADFMLRALESDPDNEEMLRRAFALVTAEGRYDNAVPLARRLVAIEPDNTLARLTLAVDAVMHDAVNEAWTHVEALPDRGLPTLYEPLLRAWLRVGEGDIEAAQDAAAVLGAREGFGTLYKLHSALLFDVAGDLERAEEAYRAQLEQVETPSLRLAWLAGNFLERIGDRASAEETYARYRAANPESALLSAAASEAPPAPILANYKHGWAEVLFDLAGVLSQERADEMALIHAYQALRLKPDLYLARLLIAEIFESQNRGDQAIAQYRKIDPASALAWTARMRVAEVLGDMERTEEAVAELEALAAERPNSFEPYYRIGNLLRTQERFAEAAEAYDRAFARVKTSERHHWSLFYFRGISLERAGQWERAEDDFLKALELEPEQPYVMNYLAYSWVEQQVHLDRAEAMLVRAVDLRPNDGYIVDSLGWVYYRLGKYEKAVTYLERAIELRPQDPVINDHLGDAYWRVGRHQEARFQWRRSLSFEPEEDRIPVIEAKIERGLAAQPENI